MQMKLELKIYILIYKDLIYKRRLHNPPFHLCGKFNARESKSIVIQDVIIIRINIMYNIDLQEQDHVKMVCD